MAHWSESSAGVMYCVGLPAAWRRARSVLASDCLGHPVRIAFLDHLDEVRAKVVPSEQSPARAAAQVKHATWLFGSPGGRRTAVSGGASAVQLLRRRFITPTARARARVHHGRPAGYNPAQRG